MGENKGTNKLTSHQRTRPRRASSIAQETLAGRRRIVCSAGPAMSGQDETQKGWSSGLKVLLLVILVARAQAFHVSPGMGALSVLSTRKARTGICVAADPVRSDSTEGGLNADTDPYAARRRRIHVMVHQLARIGSGEPTFWLSTCMVGSAPRETYAPRSCKLLTPTKH